MLPMTDIRSVTVEEEFEKNPDLRREDLDQLRGWLDTQKQLPEIKDEMLIMFHHSCYFDLARTKKCIDSYYTIRTIAPDFFTNRDLTIPQLKKSMEALHMAILPVPHPKGYHIFYHGLRDFEPAKYNHVDDYKLTYMSVDAWLLRNGTVPGLVLIMDMKGAKLGHLARVSLQAIRIGSRYVQEASPLRLKGIHVTNTVPWVDKAMAIIRPFTNKEIFDLVHFHKGDLETLYQHIPQECLPSDLGGTLPSLEILSAENTRIIGSLRDYFLDEEKYRVDESQREKKKKNKKTEENPNHLFKKLEID